MKHTQTGWVDEETLTEYRGKMHGAQLLVVYFQKAKPNVFRQGKPSKMIKIKIEY